MIEFSYRNQVVLLARVSAVTAIGPALDNNSTQGSILRIIGGPPVGLSVDSVLLHSGGKMPLLTHGDRMQFMIWVDSR